LEEELGLLAVFLGWGGGRIAEAPRALSIVGIIYEFHCKNGQGITQAMSDTLTIL
jgi:hypothetical protein